MAEQEKKRAIRRLKSVYALRAKVDESYREGQEAMKAGQPTVWGMLNFYYGDPILKAMGIHSVYPENYGAAVAALGEAEKYLDYADAEGVPTHLCGYSRVNIGYAAMMMKEAGGNIPPGAPMGGIPKPLFLMSSAAICDHRYKWFQSLGRYMDVPVWSFEAPLPGVKELYLGEAFEKAAEMGTRHLKDFITFVENISGRKMDWAKLEETVDLMLDLNRLWYETNLLRKAVPCPMHSRDFWTAMPPALFSMGDLKDALECYKNLNQEIQERVNNGIGAVEEEKFRLLFAELPPWHSLWLFDKLAERGWNFVIESFGYHPPKPLDLSGVTDPLEKISRFNLQFQLGSYDDAHRHKISAGYMAFAYFDYAKDFKCDGAFLHPLVSCRSASTHLPYVASMLMDKLKVPSFIVEGDIVDLRLFDPQDALAKAEPFEETMKHYRQIRKENGFDW